MTRPVVAVTRRLPAAVEAALARRFTVRPNPDDHQYSEDELRAALEQADGLLSTVTDPLTARTLAAEPLRARIVANFGVGYDHIDLDAARRRGLVVTNTPGVLTEDTADLAIALMLSVARRLGEGEREVRAGAWTGWRPTHMLGTRLTGKVLGVVGFGRIGRAVAHRARHGFGMRILYATRSEPAAAAAAVVASLEAEPRSLDRLLGESDFVSLHVPAAPETRHLIDARRLALMRPGAFLVNTARGGVVDQEALADALESGALGGAGLDVYPAEPHVAARVLAAPNTVLLPHLGSATIETRTAMGMRALANLEAFFDGRAPADEIDQGGDE